MRECSVKKALLAAIIQKPAGAIGCNSATARARSGFEPQPTQQSRMSDTIAMHRKPAALFYLFSPLPAGECVARLGAMMGADASLLDGWVTKERFRVCWRCPPRGITQALNPCRPFLFGGLRDFHGTTMVHCHFTLHPAVIGVLVALAGFSAAAATLSLDGRWFAIPLLALLFVAMASALAWRERELIMLRLAGAINARRL
jgi:hypothetical protein